MMSDGVGRLAACMPSTELITAPATAGDDLLLRLTLEDYL